MTTAPIKASPAYRAGYQAALEDAYDRLLERSLSWRQKVCDACTDMDADHAAAKQLEARACASIVFALK